MRGGDGRPVYELDGVPDPPADGTGLRSMAQRTAAVGGEFDIGRPALGGTLVRFQLLAEAHR